MTVQNLASIEVYAKKQSVLATPVSGTGARGLTVTASQGIQQQVTQIESALLKRNRMKSRARGGYIQVSAAYETENAVGRLTPFEEAILGTTQNPGFDIDEGDVTSFTIVVDGTTGIATVTVASGDLYALLLVAGMVGKFSGLSVPANNTPHFPIIDVPTNRTFRVPAGYLIANSVDTVATLTIIPFSATPTTYVDTLWTVEERQAGIDRSKLGSDMRWNKLGVDLQPNQPCKVSLGLGGRKLENLDSASSPNFTSPTFVDAETLVGADAIDGGIYVNGVLKQTITGFTFGLEAAVSGLPVLFNRYSPDVFIGPFSLTGQFTGAVEDGTNFDHFLAEDQISVILFLKDPNGGFKVYYLGNLAFGGYNTPAGGEGATIETIPLLGGDDARGAGYARTSVMISEYIP